MPDRRRIARWQINRRTKVSLEGMVDDIPCTVSDINFKGTKISLKEKLAPDTLLKMNIKISEQFSLMVDAWVAWHKTIDARNVYGLIFTKMRSQDKDMIYRYMRQHFPDQVNRRWWQGAEGWDKKGGENMGKTEFKDKRIFSRVGADFSLKFLDLNSNREGLARTRDICAKGMRIVTKDYLEPKTPLEVWLEIPDKGEPLYARGEVIWSRPLGLEEYCAGINLERADLMGFSRVFRAK